MKMDRVGTVENFETRPEKFGRYILLDRIGAGGMAEVFRAVMPGVEGFQRTFVVKRILAERAQSPYFVDMFVQEARINALLHHPNIVQVFDFGHVGGTYFLAMEYVRGRDVSEILRRLRRHERRCPVGVAAYIAREVAMALSYAHALAGADGQPLNIVHRDVSPSNIICPRTGGVKLLDFGIAKALGEAEMEKTGVGLFKGKISYIAPERIKDLPADGRSDLFSLGVVLWELLAGRKLFRGKSEFDTLKNVAEMEVPRAVVAAPRRPAGAGSHRRPRAGARSRRAVRDGAGAGRSAGRRARDAAPPDAGAARSPARAVRRRAGVAPDSDHRPGGRAAGGRHDRDLERQSPPRTGERVRRPRRLQHLDRHGGAGAPEAGLDVLYRRGDRDRDAAAAPRRARRGRALAGGDAARGRVGGVGGAASGAPPLPKVAPPVGAPASRRRPPQPRAEAPADDAETPRAKPAHRAHWSGKGRIARGLSVDPFAEAASRVGR